MANDSALQCPLHEATARALADAGIDTVFGLIGDANLFTMQAFVSQRGGRFVAAAHEAGATLMAIGYAVTSGKPGVVSVTHGPGLTNTLTALVEGVKARVPLLLLCGDTPAENREHFQNVHQREFILATGAGFEQVRTSETALQDLARALRRAVLERRPIALNIPSEFEWQQVTYEQPEPRVPDTRARVRHGEDLDNAVGILAAARSPIVLAGRGAIGADAEAALTSLAERTGALLATTLKAKGLFIDNPFNLGVFGTLSTPAANDLILQSDCVIAFGASLNKYTTGYGSLLQGKRVIECNADAAAVGQTIKPDAGLIGDPALIAEDLIYWLDEAEIAPSGFRTEDARQSLASCDPFADLENTATATTVDLTRALLRLNEVIPRNRIFVTDVGRYVGQAWKAIDVTVPGAFIHTAHFGSIGLGMGCAIGAATAAPKRPALLVTGDGGFMLGGLTEFNTAVRENTDLIVVVCNDGSYGAEHVQYAARDRDTQLSVFDWPEFAGIAVALGGTGISVRNAADLEQACEAIRQRSGPLLIDLKLNPERMIPLDY